MTNQVKITPVTPRILLGEGPHWVEKENCLLYVDIPKGNIHKYFYDTKRSESIHLDDAGTGETLSFVIPVEGQKDEYVVGLGKSLASVKWPLNPQPEGKVNRPVPILSVDLESNTRFNDAKCDPSGRLFAGTMHKVFDAAILEPHLGSLYSFNQNLKQTSLIEKVSISNGLAWTKDTNTFYFIDTTEYRIDAFDYDNSTGNISNKRVVLDYKSPPGVQGFPDGMSIDIKGNLWVACYNGYQVICVDPTTGKVVRSINIPSAAVTSTCWGGPDYSTLFVTTASMDTSQGELSSFPDTGKTFAVTGLDTKGLPPTEFKVDPMYWVK